MRYQYQITKYNPDNRNSDGVYRADEWTSYSDIGKTFLNQKLSRRQYLEIEQAYLLAINQLLTESSIKSLTLRQLEKRNTVSLENASLQDGAELDLKQIITFAQLALREKVWGKLVASRRAYIHFGWDYYLYMGVPKRCPQALKMISEHGLFIEERRSPYLRGRPKISL